MVVCCLESFVIDGKNLLFGHDGREYTYLGLPGEDLDVERNHLSLRFCINLTRSFCGINGNLDALCDCFKQFIQ